MRRIFFGLTACAACVVCLAVAGEASAHPGRYARGGRVARSVHVRPGIRFAGGHFYHRNDFHWTRRVWDAHYNRYQYWDPNYSCWYYYDPIRLGYYPY